MVSSIMMIVLVVMIIVNFADPGCQEEEDLGARYAGTATVTVGGKFVEFKRRKFFLKNVIGLEKGNSTRCNHRRKIKNIFSRECQEWSSMHPHSHSYGHVGDHK